MMRTPRFPLVTWVYSRFALFEGEARSPDVPCPVSGEAGGGSLHRTGWENAEDRDGEDVFIRTFGAVGGTTRDPRAARLRR